MAYKSCCDNKCFELDCEVRLSGGCICACLLKHREQKILDLLNGGHKRRKPVSSNEKYCFQKELEEISEEIKKYQVSDEEQCETLFS